MTEQKTYNRQYDAYLLWAPTTKCNLDCVYCFFHDKSKLGKGRASCEPLSLMNKVLKASRMSIPQLIRIFNSEIYKIYKKKKKVSPINIPALIRTLDRTKKIFKIGFAGGEPFLVPNIIDAFVEITKRHFIGFNTNLITGDIDEFLEKINPERVQCIIASLHIKELEKYNLLDKYINRFLRFQNCGFDIRAQEVAYPPLLSEMEKYKQFFKKRGITIGFDAFLGEYNGKRYPWSYTDEELKIFGLDSSCRNKFSLRNKICNAGYNVGTVSPTGVIYPCFHFHGKPHEEIGHIYKKIKFKNKLRICPFDFCTCPISIFDPYLFQKAKSETNSNL